MFKAINDLLAQFGRSLDVSTEMPPVFSDDDERLCAAALMVHVAMADGRFNASERSTMLQLLTDRFAMDQDAARSLLEYADARGREGFDVDDFTGGLRRVLDRAGRLRVVQMMWDVAMSDGSVHEFEDNLIWRIAEMLGLSLDDMKGLRTQVPGRT